MAGCRNDGLVQHFRREDFLRNGPLVDGAAPEVALDRLFRFKEELKIRDRKNDSYRGGEELFALPLTEYPDLSQTQKEMKLADQLFSLYQDVINTINDWKQIPWSQIVSVIADMSEKIEQFRDVSLIETPTAMKGSPSIEKR